MFERHDSEDIKFPLWIKLLGLLTSLIIIIAIILEHSKEALQ